MWLCAYLGCNDPLFLPFWCFKPSLSPPFILKKRFFHLFPLFLMAYDNTSYSVALMFMCMLSEANALLLPEAGCMRSVSNKDLLLCNDPLFLPFWCFKPPLYPPFILKK